MPLFPLEEDPSESKKDPEENRKREQEAFRLESRIAHLEQGIQAIKQAVVPPEPEPHFKLPRDPKLAEIHLERDDI